MRKLLILMLVFGIASLANAYVIEVVTVGDGSLGHAGTSTDPLELSEIIEIAIVLNNNPYTGYPLYDGYVLDTMDLDLHVTGAGSLSAGVIGTSKTGDILGIEHHAMFDVWSESDPLIVGNSIDKLLGGSFGYIHPGEEPLVWNLLIHCEGEENVVIDLTLRGTTQYWDYWDPANDQPYTGYPADHDVAGWAKYATEGDLGDLVIHQVPEPATIALLGLGSLFLMRRRRK